MATTVYYYGGGTGHIGLGVNSGPSYGYYPNGSYGSNFLTLLGISVPGAEVEDSFLQGSPTSQVTIYTTPEQDSSILGQLEALQRNGGSYNLYGNNCAAVAENVLQNAGVPGIPSTPWPSSLIGQLQDNQANQALQSILDDISGAVPSPGP